MLWQARLGLIAGNPAALSPAGSTPFSVTRTHGDFQNTGLSTYTFNSVAVGTYSVGRVIAVFVATRIGAPTGVTIGGVTATKAIGVTNGGNASMDLYYVDAASSGGPVTGTSVTVVVSYGGAQTRAAIQVFSILGASAAAPNVASSTLDLPTENTVAIPSGGSILIGIFTITDGGSWGGTSLILDNETIVNGGSQAVSALHSAPGDLTGTPTVAPTGGGVTNATVFASWGP